ncbi:MAG: MotA/TolQ/ExbB proton channel family protein [Myxococcales bacterium]|nr:MAG: MotA/TolQ/ExbB proton channel family protein [Myxococcales bacterium]
MVDRLLNMALIGGEPILYLLVLLSLLSVAVVLERYTTYLRNRIDLPSFTGKIVNLLNVRDMEGALSAAEAIRAAEARVAAEGLRNFDKGPTVVTELMESMAMREQQQLDRRVTILGTVGANAPFIGLLGTVLGIIKAFNDLAFNSQGGPSVVMAGIAEALVATAVGLLVAIPAVVFFNYFKNRQKEIMSHMAQLQKTLLAFLGERERQGVETVGKAV